MATAPKVTYPHIVKAPGVRGGKAHIEGTRICVADLVWHEKTLFEDRGCRARRTMWAGTRRLPPTARRV